MPEIIGEAYVALRPTGTEQFAAEAKKTVSTALAGIATGVAATKVVGFFKDSLSAASDFNESASKAEQIFGKNSDAIRKWADGAVSDFGQTSTSALENAASFGNMFQQLDIGGQEATKMSKSMVELASDFASFHNADISEVLLAQQAAFRGEYDAVQRFVPTLNAAAVEMQALAETGKTNTKELTAGEKAAATYTLMMEGAGKAMGDFDRTSGGAANQQRQLSAAFQQLQITIGAALLPVLVKVMGVLKPILEFFAANQVAATALAVVIGGALVAAFVAWTINMVKSTIATLSFSKATDEATASSSRLGATMKGALPILGAFGAIFAAGALISSYTGKLYDLGNAVNELGRVGDRAQVKLFALSAAEVALDHNLKPLAAQMKVFQATAQSSIPTAERLIANLKAAGVNTEVFEKALAKEIRAQERSAAAAAASGAAHDKQGDEVGKLTLTYEELIGVLNDQVNASLGSEGAAISMDRAIEDLNRTLSETAITTLEGRDAFNNAKSSVVDFGQKIYDEMVATKGAEQATRDQIGALAGVRDSLAPGSPLRTFLDGYINDLTNRIPGEVYTQFRLRIANETGLSLGDLNYLDSIPSLDIGGYVPGPVGKPRLIVAHGGEYVNTAAEVASGMTGTSSGDGTVIFNVMGGAIDTISQAHLAARTYRVHMQMAGR